MNTEEEKTEEEKQKFYMKQKSFFLTYPQCNEEKQTIFNYWHIIHSANNSETNHASVNI